MLPVPGGVGAEEPGETEEMNDLRKKQTMIALLWLGIFLFRLMDVLLYKDTGHLLAFSENTFLCGCILSLMILYNPLFWRVRG